MLKISILGAGSFGFSMAHILASFNHDITIWSYSKKDIQNIKTNKKIIQYIPEIFTSTNIKITYDISTVFSSDVILICVPSFAVKSTINMLKNNIPKSTIIVCLSKGLEETSLKLFSEIIEETLDNPCAILSGPSHAEELARDITTAVVVSSKNQEISKYIQKTFSSSVLRIYINDDIIGVQIGAALKNIIALAIGICDGMKLGDNTKAALMTRGLNEISLLGTALGAKKETFSGLSGIGDLIVTCTSLHSRNRQAGILISQGLNIQDAINQIGMTVEGYTCTKCAYTLSQKYNLELPIINSIYEILYNNKNPNKILEGLISRPYKYEL